MRQMGPVPFEAPAKGNPRRMEQASGFSRRAHILTRHGKKIPAVVDTAPELTGGRAMDNLAVRGNHHRRQQVGMGSPRRRENFSRKVAGQHQKQILQLQGALCGLGSPASEPVGSEKSTCPDIVRQHNGSLIPETPGRSETSTTPGTRRSNIRLGRRGGPLHNGNPPRGFSEHSSRLSKQTAGQPDRVGAKRRNLPSALSALGNPQYRPVCKPEELKGRQILLLEPSRSPGRSRYPEPGLDGTPLVCIPATGADTGGTQEDLRGPRVGDINSAILAKEKLVSAARSHGSRKPSRATPEGRCYPPGADSPSRPSKATPLGMDTERDILRTKGLSEQVISTLLASRKPVTSAIYRKVWKRFCLEGGRSDLSAGTPDLPSVLDFLQSGYNKGFKPSTLKVQISALSAFFDYPLASHPWVVRFIKATQRLRPTIRQLTLPWDLGLVLGSLCRDPYMPSDRMSISTLSQKTAFLVAITTAKRIGEIQALSTKDPYLQIRDDHVTLRLDPAFIPKVASYQNINQEIVLPSFCSNPRNEKEQNSVSTP
ncbi:acyl-CoA-binding domain-containing protein 7 isoform X1 [Dendrobates tinctorius]|uniref:acyl-CoA-binding domain-containing protein 7 isoform X1 n=1 Tax=Dendrobates tinctorius TaxID=92724 RepID=UPI003CCA57C9